MNDDIFLESFLKNFPCSPSSSQREGMERLSAFVQGESLSRIFVMKGYAGTGKTTIIASLVKTIRDFKGVKGSSILMAPTGRAAKIMSQYSGEKAYTIHKQIYALRTRKGGGISFTLKPNRSVNTLFIVDEASMITDRNDNDSYGSLLDDLLSYVTSGRDCKLLLVGDTAQLPPVGYSDSPALDIRVLENNYGMPTEEIFLTDVYRQSEESMILHNATTLRKTLERDNLKKGVIKFRTGEDFVRLRDGYDIQCAIEGATNSRRQSEAIIITRSNRRAGLFNGQIRSRIKLHEGEIATGDLLMVVKNNYFWVDEDSPCGFIANGDLAEVMAVRESGIIRYGMRFARVELKLVDYPQMSKFEALVLLDTIYSESAALSEAQSSAFYNEVMKDYEKLSMRRRHDELSKNEYYNAIQVKFGYAVTCHKSQGGGWDNVFIEQVWLPDENLPKDYIRWLYTAITRAKEKVFMIGFTDDFFEENDL